MLPAEFDFAGFKALRPGLQKAIRLLGQALRTNIEQELERNKTDALLEQLGRPDTAEGQNALIAFGNADPTLSSDDAYSVNENLITSSFLAMKRVRLALESELSMLSSEERDRFKVLSDEVIKALRPLAQNADMCTRWGLAAASTAVLGGSLAIILNSDENAYKIRAPATNVMWGLEILTIALSETADARQFFDAFVMRFGVSFGTQAVALIDLFHKIEAGPRKSAAIILPNLAILFGHVLLPIAKSYSQSWHHEKRAKKILASAGMQSEDGNVARAFFDRTHHALTEILDGFDQEVGQNPPDNKTLAKVTAAKSAISGVRNAVGFYLEEDPLPKDAWKQKIEKLPSFTYAHVVAILQIVSALGNVKTLGDNSTFLVLILTLCWESFLHPRHSPEFMAVKLMRYSAGMFISFFTAGIHLMRHGHAVFDKDPVLTRNMAIVTSVLNLTIAVHFVPAFKLVTSAIIKLIQSAGRRDIACRTLHSSAEAIPLIAVYEDWVSDGEGGGERRLGSRGSGNRGLGD